MDIRPIHTEQDYDTALKDIDALFGCPPETPECDRLEVLSVLVDDYEKKRFSIPLPDPIEAIKYHAERLGLSRKDLETFIGGAPRVSEILHNKRPLTIWMMRDLSKGLGIPLDVLAQPYALNMEKEQRTPRVLSLQGSD